jgi:PAS domain S-box-containing protein
MISKVYKPKKSKCSAKPEQNQPPVRSEFEQLAEASNDAVRIINNDFTIRYFNHAFAKMTGVDQNNVLGKKCWEVFPSSLCHTPECRANRVLNGEKKIEVEIERQKHDGTTIPCLASTLPLKNNAGNIIGIIEQFSDITEHRKMEDRVKETENFYRSLIELGGEVGEAIVMLQDIDGAEGIQTFVSDQWTIITGYTKEELLGTSFFDLVVPDNYTQCVERYREKVLGKAMPGPYEIKIVSKDGTQTDIELTGASTEYQGKPANVIYIREIAERKQLENALEDERDKYRSLFDDAPITLWEMDYSDIKKYLDKLRTQGVVDFHEHFETHPDDFVAIVRLSHMIRVNRSHFVLFESQDNTPEEIEKREKEIFYKYPENYQALKDDYARMANGETTFIKEESVRTMKKNIRHILTKFTIAPGHEDKWDRVFASLTDITKRKEAEDELKRYKDNLEELVKERTSELEESRKQLEEEFQTRIEFTRALVHELKTPLTPMLGTSEILASDLQDEPYSSYARSLYQGSCQLDKRVDELLDIARGEIGILKLNCEKVDTRLLLRDVADFMNVEAAKRSQKVIVDLCPSVRFLWADNERLKQILMNLLTNAFKFTQEGGTITLKAFGIESSMVLRL